jgi:hypothetical protein
MKTYSELMTLPSYKERLKYLSTHQRVSELTFNGSRYLNQVLYSSKEWKRIRRQVIIRDNGCDLADPDRPIIKGITIHHIEPLTVEDVVNRSEKVFDMNNLITVSTETHRRIHYGDCNDVCDQPTDRKADDTIPWK